MTKTIVIAALFSVLAYHILAGMADRCMMKYKMFEVRDRIEMILGK